MKIAIVGLGLMGGSFAKALKKYTNHQVFAYDINQNSIKKALSENSIDKELSLCDLDKQDLIVLALRAQDAINFVKANKNIRGNLMEFCGVKRFVSEQVQKLSTEYGFNYIGAHPMAGREVGGYENSKEDLYQNRSMLLIKHGRIDEWIIDTLKAIGFSIKMTNDKDHDRIIAYTSQLCHITSNALVKSKTSREHHGFSADSLKDLTRVATIDEKMWTELFLLNKDNLLFELNNYIKELGKYKEALEKDDSSQLEMLLRDGKEKKALMYPKKEN